MLNLDPRQYITSPITRDKVGIWHPLIFLKIFSVVPQGSTLAPLFFLIFIKNLPNDIVSLVKQKYMHALMFVHINQWDLNRGSSNSTESAFFD